MDYTILQTNDDATATVQLNINGSSLVQDFPLGQTQDDLTASIMQGMADFQTALAAQPTLPYTPDNIGVAVPVQANSLPVTEPPITEPPIKSVS